MTQEGFSQSERQRIQGLFTSDQGLANMQRRTMASNCPPLRGHLYPGAKVLDVGCGPGGITVDVARAVDPGSVTGVDCEERSISAAAEFAQRCGVDNATFRVGDAHELDFADGTFDIVYALNTIEHLDPARALQEWKRVTKRGGCVMATMSDMGTCIYYPPCPAYLEYVASFPTMRREPHLGRKGLELFSEVGFADVQVELYAAPEFCLYRGAPDYEALTGVPDYRMWPRFFREGLDLEGRSAARLREQIDSGLIDKETILAAQRELDAWLAHPHAFAAQVLFLVAGRA